MTVARFDRGRFGKTTRTPQGFLKAPGFFTRVGVFEYRRADGSVIRELRPADEVFKADSLQSLKAAPVTLDHPPQGMVTPENVQDLLVGMAGESVGRQDDKVAGDVILMKSDVIKDVLDGKLKEFSCGYRCRIDATPGDDPDFGRYDQVQRDIVYNHIAIGAPNWGRAGGDISLRLDSNDAVQIEPKPEPRADNTEKPKMETIVIGGVEFEVPKAAAQAMRADAAQKEAAVQEAKAALEAVQGRLDGKEAAVKDLAEKLAAAEAPERLDAAVAERVALNDAARKVMGKDADVTGTKREVMERVLKHDNADLALGEKSDDYVAARFDAAVEAAANKPEPKTKKADVRGAVVQARKDSRVSGEEARQKMVEQNRNAWKIEPKN